MNKYLTILTDSLVKKSAVLDTISDICTQHEECLFTGQPDFDRYNELSVKKGELIDDLNRLDDGFTALYERVAPALRDDPAPYADSIRKLKSLVSEVSEKTALIQAREMRIASRIENLANSGKQHTGPRAGAAEAAMKYYRTMNKTNVTSAIFVDNRKGKQ